MNKTIFSYFFDIRGKNLSCIDLYKNREIYFLLLKTVLILHRIFLHFSGSSNRLVSLSFYPFEKEFCTLVAKGCNNIGVEFHFNIYNRTKNISN